MKPSILLTTVGLASMATSASAETFLKPIADSNLRLESVEQQGFADKAEAVTWRNRLGFQTATRNKLSFLVEIENTTALTEDYNSTLNGKTTYPTIPDPEVTELNRAQIIWTPTAATTVTAGRQRIVLDDARFVGTAGWRQDEQTFDGIRLDTGTGKFKVTAAWLTRINRVIGDEKDWESESYLLNASYDFGPPLKVTGFSYGLNFSSDAKTPTATDIANAKASSVTITGARLSGGRKLSGVNLGYVAQYAVERDAGDNPRDVHLEEKMFEVSLGYKWVSGKINFESLGGDGTVGFVSPLASPHPFQGFADAFSATGGHKTFVNGINDLSYTLSVSLPGTFKPTISLIGHDYSTTRLDQEIGTEWDIVATVALTPKLSLMLKHADFERDNPAAPASRKKTWLMLSYKL